MARPTLTVVVVLTIVALTSAASAQPGAGAPPVATAPAAPGPSYEAPAWVRERRHAANHQSSELIRQSMRETPMFGWPRPTDRGLTPAQVVRFSLRRVEDLELLAAYQEGAARELDVEPAFTPPEVAHRAHRRAERLAEATRLREAAVSTARVALDRAPEAPHADELLFRMAGLLAAPWRTIRAQRGRGGR